MLLIMLKYRIRGLFFFVLFGCFRGLFFTKRMSFWNDHANIIDISAHLPFLSSCFSEIHIKFDCFFSLYFLPLNIVNQTLNTFKTYQSFESSWKTPYCALWIFKPFSLSHMTSVFSSNGHVHSTVCRIFPSAVAHHELQLCSHQLPFERWEGRFRPFSMNPGTIIFALEE